MKINECSIQEYKNEEIFLKNDIDRLYGELEESSNILDSFQTQMDPQISSSPLTNKQDIQMKISKSTKLNSLNRVNLTEALNTLLNLNHITFEKLKSIKVLEGKLAAMNYDELQHQMNNFTEQLFTLKQRLQIATEKRQRYESIGELMSELDQRDRIIVHLVNILRNLDDKILYARSNKPCVNKCCNYYQSYSSPKKYEYSCCTYHSMSYPSVLNSPRYKAKDKVYSEKYESFIPSEEELKNLIPESLFFKIRKISVDSYDIDGIAFKYIRDSRGDTYAQTSTEIKPLYQFLDRFKGVVARPRHKPINGIEHK